jgi:hypothetical protein
MTRLEQEGGLLPGPSEDANLVSENARLGTVDSLFPAGFALPGETASGMPRCPTDLNGKQHPG